MANTMIRIINGRKRYFKNTYSNIEIISAIVTVITFLLIGIIFSN